MKQNRIDEIRRLLKKEYPDIVTQLDHANAFQMLVATILSAQCTDKQVNKVTPKLFAAYPTPEDFQKAPIKSIEALIRTTGFFHNKAKNIKNCAEALVEDFNGEVPQTLEELVTLPGVGRKTANCVLGSVFGTPGVVVDTHVARISYRLGLTKEKNPVKIEFDLMAKIPKEDWSDFSLILVYFGRDKCKARKPLCDQCPIEHLCKSADKTTN